MCHMWDTKPGYTYTIYMLGTVIQFLYFDEMCIRDSMRVESGHYRLQ